MSTILKSLKKLEQQKECNPYTGSGTAYRGPGAVDLGGAKHGWIRAPWFKRSLLAVIIVGLGVSSLYFYSQSRKNNDNQFALNETSHDRPQPAVNTPAQKPQRSVRSPKRGRIPDNNTSHKPSASFQKPTRQAPMSRTVQRESSTSGRVQSPPSSNMTRAESNPIVKTPARSTVNTTNAVPDTNNAMQPTRTEPAPRASARKPDTRTESSLPSRSPVKPDEKQPPKPPSESHDNVSILKDGRLKVQAIVWSTISDDRMTVINSRVLHEGDELDGFTVVSIRPDDVVVKEGSGTWKVLFGRP